MSLLVVYQLCIATFPLYCICRLVSPHPPPRPPSPSPLPFLEPLLAVKKSHIKVLKDKLQLVLSYFLMIGKSAIVW